MASNGIFVLGGLLAYQTSIGLDIVVAVALVAAMAGLWPARAQNIWMDRAASVAAGFWAAIAMLILIPYITVEEGVSLWSLRAYSTLSIVVASAGMLAWNAAAAMAQQDAGKTVRSLAAFHLGALLVAAWLALGSDGQSVTYVVRGFEIPSHDLRLAPALAAVPGVAWLIVGRQTK